MFRRISLLNKRGFFQKKDNFHRGFLFSPLLIIPLFLVIISGLLIKSIQGDLLVSNYLSHILTGFLCYFLAFFISYIPLERLRKYMVPFYLSTLISLLLIYFFGGGGSGWGWVVGGARQFWIPYPKIINSICDFGCQFSIFNIKIEGYH